MVLTLKYETKGIYSYVVQPGDVPTKLAHGDGVINIDAVRKTLQLRQMLEDTIGTSTETPELAYTFVKLVVDQDARLLSEKYINPEQDLGEVLQEARNRNESRIIKERLYMLKIDEL
jgi:hypothetical protein